MKTPFKKIYFIGITGTSVSGLAVIAKQFGYKVMGSDVAKTFTTTAVLKKEKISFHRGFQKRHLAWNPDIVVVGASWDESNEEVAEALRRKIPVLRASEFLNEVARGREMISIAGVHGKTTTTSFITYLLLKSALHPSFMIGSGKVPDIGTNAHGGKGKYFVVESDEYKKSPNELTSKFLDYSPKYVILTSIELDHTDFFPNLASVKTSFRKLLQKKSVRKIYANVDDRNVQSVLSGLGSKVVRVGTKKGCDVQISEVEEGELGTRFLLESERQAEYFTTKLPGLFGVRNVSLCLALAHDLGLSWKKLAPVVKNFQGAERRFQLSRHGKYAILDDFGHHPTAVRLTLEAARKRFPNKHIICVYQPHQVSRTVRFKNEFAHAFGACNEVLFTDIFASARERSGGYTAQQLALLTKKYHPHVQYGGSLAETAQRLNRRKLDQNTLLVTMGAGDVYTLRKMLKK
jgi:UDP-N-acetylmuramate--alanine ligase